MFINKKCIITLDFYSTSSNSFFQFQYVFRVSIVLGNFVYSWGRKSTMKANQFLFRPISVYFSLFNRAKTESTLIKFSYTSFLCFTKQFNLPKLILLSYLFLLIENRPISIPASMELFFFIYSFAYFLKFARAGISYFQH